MDDFFDEDGEQLMDPDARSPSPERQAQPYDGLEDDLDDEGADWNRDRSPTPVHGGDDGSSSRPRKRLLKKGGGGKGDGGGGMPADDLEDWGEDAAAGLADDDVGGDPDADRKRKGSSSLRDLARGGGKDKHEKKKRKLKRTTKLSGSLRVVRKRRRMTDHVQILVLSLNSSLLSLK